MPATICQSVAGNSSLRAEARPCTPSTLDCETTVVEDVSDAVAEAMSAAGPKGAVAVVGSLYVAGEARESLIGTGFHPSGVHVRLESVVDDDTEDDDDEPWVETDDAWAEADDDG